VNLPAAGVDGSWGLGFICTGSSETRAGRKYYYSICNSRAVVVPGSWAQERCSDDLDDVAVNFVTFGIERAVIDSLHVC
jgi:hypothetical protein